MKTRKCKSQILYFTQASLYSGNFCYYLRIANCTKTEKSQCIGKLLHKNIHVGFPSVRAPVSITELV